MKIEIAQHSRMSERGSSLLRLIQNNDMPILDLLVRESIQNSLDAAIEGQGHIDIEYHIKEFNSTQVNKHLEGITANLNKKFPNGAYKLLEIRDSNTTGLTGPLHYNDVSGNEFGNLLKLIYEISMPQQQEGAGGSWGLGKTVYFRIGIGLVFYYSRIKNADGRYSSRLAACLVEDEQKPDTLINMYAGKPGRGIAWWGQKVDDTTTMPLTQEDEIYEILKSFNTKPYVGHETGTTIIIPYIDESFLLEGIMPSNGNENCTQIIKPWWMNTVHDYLKVAIQRWYAPRLMNKNYSGGRWLRVKVNGEGITTDTMLPLFRIAQALYNRTPIVGHTAHETDILTDTDPSIHNVILKNMFYENGCAGYISFIKLNREELLMTYPYNNPNPFIQINKFDGEQDMNPPIIMYVRKPGMIIGYETTGSWTDGIMKTSKDEYIIGVFVANSSNTIKNDNMKMTLEQYLRKSEKADHTSWTDWSIGAFRPNIVSKIQRQVKKYISAKYQNQANENYAKRNIGLGRVLADLLLPPESFGFRANTNFIAPNGGSTGNLGNPSRGFALRIVGQPFYENGKVKVDFELGFGKKSDKVEIQLQVLSETGGILAEKWECDDVIGKAFPLRFEEIEISKVKTGRKEPSVRPQSLKLGKYKEVSDHEGIKLKFLKTQKYGVPYGVAIHVPERSGYTLSGTAYFTGNGEQIQGVLTAVQNEGENA